MTCGFSGNTGDYAEKFVCSIGKTWMEWRTFYMPGSCLAFMENPDLEHTREMNHRAKEQLETIAL